MAFQGNGKIRLLAKNGIYRDNATTARGVALANTIAQASVRHSNPDADIYWRNRLNEETREVTTYELGNYYVEFDVSPDITESGSANYAEISDIRGPASILIYQGTPSRNFSINAKFVARTTKEASRVADQIHVLKSWRMPESTSGGGVGLTPPTLLYLQGYGNMLKDIPVVMTDLSIELSSDNDIIQSSNGNDVPIITQVNISLKEAHSLNGKGIKSGSDGLNTFDILDYRLGILKGW